MKDSAAPLPVVKWTKKGGVLCPVCGALLADVSIAVKKRLGRTNAAECRSKPGETHYFRITDEAAFEINRIWDRLVGADKGLAREFIRNIEENPLDDLLGGRGGG